MALRKAAKMLSRKLFSSGTTSGVTKNRFETIRDDKLRNFCVRLEQATEEANQLRDEYNTVCAIKRAFPKDQRLWLGLIFPLVFDIGLQFKFISKKLKAIEDKESQLSAILNKKQESQFLPA